MIRVTLLMAMTLDGKIAQSDNHLSLDWTSQADKKLFIEITKEAGAIIMGRKTFDTIKKGLPQRKNIILTTHPEQYKNEENLEFTNKSPESILQQLERENYDNVILAGGSEINTIFAKKNLIHEVVITVAPHIFGKGINLFSDMLDLNLKLKNCQKIDDNTVCLSYQVLM